MVSPPLALQAPRGPPFGGSPITHLHENYASVNYQQAIDVYQKFCKIFNSLQAKMKIY
jgi:hypothetical protein